MKFSNHLLGEREIENHLVQPSFSQNCKTNIGKLFLKLVRKNFPKNDRFRKKVNLNILKLSYSSMANLQSLINKHNSK